MSSRWHSVDFPSIGEPQIIRRAIVGRRASSDVVPAEVLNVFSPVAQSCNRGDIACRSESRHVERIVSSATGCVFDLALVVVNRRVPLGNHFVGVDLAAGQVSVRICRAACVGEFTRNALEFRPSA